MAQAQQPVEGVTSQQAQDRHRGLLAAAPLLAATPMRAAADTPASTTHLWSLVGLAARLCAVGGRGGRLRAPLIIAAVILRVPLHCCRGGPI